MRFRPTDYRTSASERLAEARTLLEAQHWTFSVYASGLAVECMLRGMHSAARPFDGRHDLVALLTNCDTAYLNEVARRRLRGPVQAVYEVWRNDLRYAHSAMTRAYLRRRGQGRQLHRGADLLRFQARTLYAACVEIITVGEQAWPQRS